MSRYRVRRSLLLAPFLQHPGRLSLSVLAIALGVALGYAVALINQAAINEFASAVQTLSGEADLVVRGPRAGFDETLYPRLATSGEVAVASPVLEVDAKVPGRREPLQVLGIDIFRAARVQPFLAGAGTGDRLDFLKADRVFLSAAAAQWLDLKKDDSLSVQVGLRVLSLRVAGVLGEAGRQRFAVVDIGAAQTMFGRSGTLNRIDLRLRPGVDPQRLAARLQPGLPPGTVIERPEADIERSSAPSRAYRVNLDVLALVALFTGGLLVFSAQALAVVRRRAQLALLRVLGVTRVGLVAMLLAEAAAVGALGALAGIALGYASAAFVVRRFGAELGGGYFRGLAPELALDWPAFALFFVLGILAAVAGSLVPALEAAGAAPASALKAGDEARAFDRLQRAWPGLAVMLAGAALTQAPPVRGLPLFGYLAIALLLLGTVMLMPCVAVLLSGPRRRWGRPRRAWASRSCAPPRGRPA
jgi:putative ABC transport system permease protein